VAGTGTLPFQQQQQQQQQQQYCLQFNVRLYRHQSELQVNVQRNVNVRERGLDSSASQ
jgi:hypothetical protein